MDLLSSAAMRQIADLRWRLLLSISIVCMAMGLLWIFKVEALAFLLHPLGEMRDGYLRVVTTGVADLFFLYLKLSAWGGLFAALPLVFFLLWGFVSPGLYAREKKFMGPILVVVPFLFYAGGAFAYFLIVPTALEFFFSYSQPGVISQPVLGEYLSFLFTMVFAFGLGFNLPAFLLLFILLGWVEVEFLQRSRRFVFIFILILATVLTPPDPFSQLMMAIPLYLLFEGALFMARRLK